MLHVGLDYLDSLPAREIPAYAVCALEREAWDTLRQISLFQIPIAIWSGDKTLVSSLRNTAVHRLGGQAVFDRRTPEQIAAEEAAIEEVKREVMRDFGLGDDQDKLNQIHAQVGSWSQLRAA